MATPSSAITRFDLSLSYDEFATMANQRNFIGPKVLPAVGVAKDSGTFRKMTVAQLTKPPVSTERAPGAPYRDVDFEWGTDSYQTVDHGAQSTMDDRQIKRFSDEIRAERIHARFAVGEVLNFFENSAAAAVFDTAVWTGAALTTAVATAWSTAASADPILNIDAAITKVKDNLGGLLPNTMILTWQDWLNMRRTARMEDLVKYVDDPKGVGSMSALMQMWPNLTNILIANGYKRTSDEGQAATIGGFWTEGTAMICHVNTAPDPDVEDALPAIGYTMMWVEENGQLPSVDASAPNIIMEEFRRENNRGSAIRARCDYQHKIIHPEAGHLLTGL